MVPGQAGRVSVRGFTTPKRMDAVVWALKEIAEKSHRITTAVQLQAFIAEKVGVTVTVQTLRTLLRRSPPAPRGEMIQLLCDVFNCRSDAFYVFTPNPVRTRQWERDRSEGKKPLPYQPNAAESVSEFAKEPEQSVEAESTGKAKSLRETFTDPRTLYNNRLISKE